MSNIMVEFDAAEAARRDIENAVDDREALLHAFTGVSNILLAILSELREAHDEA